MGQRNQAIKIVMIVLLALSLAGCSTRPGVGQQAATPLPSLSPTDPSPKTLTPTPSPTPKVSLPEPPIRYPVPRDDAPPTTIAGEAVRHLAGWLHVPSEAIRLVSIEPAKAPASLAESCVPRLDTEGPSSEEKLITLETGGRRYGYYAFGEALLLCPVKLP
jgi:hypothetical protein